MLRIIVACLILHIHPNCAFDHQDRHEPQNDCDPNKNGSCNDDLDLFKLSARNIRYYLYYPIENKTKHQNQNGLPLVTGVIPLVTDSHNDSLDEILVKSLFGRRYYISNKPSTHDQPASTRKYLIDWNPQRSGIPWHHDFYLGRYHHLYNFTSQENNATSKIPAIIQNIQKIARNKSGKGMGTTSLKQFTEIFSTYKLTTEKTNKNQASIKSIIVIKPLQRTALEKQTNKKWNPEKSATVPKNPLIGKQTIKNWETRKLSSPKKNMTENQPYMKSNEAKSASLSKKRVISQPPIKEREAGKLITLSKTMLTGKPSYRKWDTERSATILKEPIIITTVPKGQDIQNSRNAWVRIQSVETPKNPMIGKPDSKKWVTVKSVTVPKDPVISKQDSKKQVKATVPKTLVIGKTYNQKWATVKSIDWYLPKGYPKGMQDSKKWTTVKSVSVLKGPVIGKQNNNKWPSIKSVPVPRGPVIGKEHNNKWVTVKSVPVPRSPMIGKQYSNTWAIVKSAPKPVPKGLVIGKEHSNKWVTVKTVTISRGPVIGKQDSKKWVTVKSASKGLIGGKQDSKIWTTVKSAPTSPIRGKKQDSKNLVKVNSVTAAGISPTRTTIGDKWAINKLTSVLKQTARNLLVTVRRKSTAKQLTTDRLANKTLEKRRSKHILW